MCGKMGDRYNDIFCYKRGCVVVVSLRTRGHRKEEGISCTVPPHIHTTLTLFSCFFALPKMRIKTSLPCMHDPQEWVRNSARMALMDMQ